LAIKGCFIGIDKHEDPDIPDLSGARRDAQALWALFSDTLPEMQAQLIIDDRATCDEVRKAIDSALGSAGADDIVVISFAGHGTQDHRLVTYNTAKSALVDTTISMQELAVSFKSSKAKVILLILDCCFSGAAPARVLEDSPRLRNELFTLSDVIGGQGRIIISASRENEPALEHPRYGHGLLTKAIMDVLQKGSDSVSLPTAMDEIAAIVRGEASKMGYEQNPVYLNYIDGGISFPVLRQGAKFCEAFPEYNQLQISGAFADLRKFGFPDAIISEWQKQFAGGLNELQVEAVNKYRIFNGDSLLVVAPTSSGKTFIGEMAFARSLLEGKKAVFLLPYRALVNEKFERFSDLYGEKLKMKIIRCSGDYSDQVSPFLKGKYDLAIFTFEMFLSVAVSCPHVLNQIGLIVLDEAQFITDPTRGISVELILTYLLSARKRDIAPQVVALSAVIGDINGFDKWQDLKVLSTTNRPVPLVEGVLDRNGVFEFEGSDGKRATSQMLHARQIVVRKQKPSAQDVIVPLIKTLLQENPKEKILVFRNMRGPCAGCAKYLAEDLGLKSADLVLEQLPSYDLSTASEDLRTSLRGGTAFHNTNLNRQERMVIEQAFRDPDSDVKVLVATTTLAAGINTPASTVIIAEQKFVGDDGREFTVAEYKNMAGRAGRLGFSEKGKSIVLVDTSYERVNLYNRYVAGAVEPIMSSFKPDYIETWLIRLLAQVQRVRKDEVVYLLLNTYGGYLANRTNPSWRDQMVTRLSGLLDKMSSLGLVENDGEYIRLSLLGKTCGQSSLSFESALRTVEILRSFPDALLNPMRLMALTVSLSEMDDSFISVQKKGQAEAVRVSEATSRFGHEVVDVLQQRVNDFLQYYARCKKCAILYDWVNGDSVGDVEKRYSTSFFSGVVNHGDIRRCADSVRFHLRSVFQIAIIMNKPVDVESMERLFRQLEVGIPEDSLDLLAIPVQLERGEYLALRSSGIKTKKQLEDAGIDVIKSILSPVSFSRVSGLMGVGA